MPLGYYISFVQNTEHSYSFAETGLKCLSAQQFGEYTVYRDKWCIFLKAVLFLRET